jgi:hypothetical protein
VAAAGGNASIGNFLDGIFFGCENGSKLSPIDTDRDGSPDFLDTDSDGSLTIPAGGLDERAGTDTVEAGSDPTRPQDSDFDGIPDYRDPLGTVPDLDGDGLRNDVDLDDDGDGITDLAEDNGEVDSDGDDIPDSQDTDSDNDGKPDLLEGHDYDSNGVADIVPSGIDANRDGTRAGPQHGGEEAAVAGSQHIVGQDDLARAEEAPRHRALQFGSSVLGRRHGAAAHARRKGRVGREAVLAD